MSRIDSLLKEKCSNGVEYRSIGSMITRVRTKGKTCKDVTQVYVVSNTMGVVRSEDYHDNEVHSEDTSNYTVIKQGMFAYNPSRLNIGSLGVLEKKETGLVSPMYVVFSVDEKVILQKYLLINLKSSVVKNRIDSLKEEGARFRFDYTRWDKIEIPVPPIEVQQEIVRILDTFTKLEAELQAELDARKKQYEYYKMELFAFGEDMSTVTLPSISVNLDRKRKPITGNQREQGVIPYYGASGVVDYVKDYLFDGDYLLVSEDGANLTARVTPIAFSISGKTWVNNHAHILQFQTDIERKFVEYYLNSIDLSYYITGAAQPKLNQDNLNKIPIPNPSFDEKKKIVEILDVFSEMCNDSKLGLPAEIEARHKQYEYYRDKLLTFERKEV